MCVISFRTLQHFCDAVTVICVYIIKTIMTTFSSVKLHVCISYLPESLFYLQGDADSIE